MVSLLWLLLPLLCASALSTFDPRTAILNSHRDLLNVQKAANPTSLRNIYGKPTAVNVANEDSCVWIEDMHRCVPSMNVTSSILSKTNDTLAKASYETILCKTIVDEAACQAVEYCTWYHDFTECDFVDYVDMYPDSPCIKVAEGFFSSFITQAKCESEVETPEECSKDPDCYWNEDDQACSIDYYMTLAGVSIDEISKAVDLIGEASVSAAFQFVSTFDVFGGSIDWQMVLEWEPDVECPEDVSERICDFITEIVVNSTPLAMYCGTKYVGPTECNRDLLCSFSFEALVCTTEDEITTDFIVEAMKELIREVEPSGDKEYILSLFICEGLPVADCETYDECLWSTIDESCHVSNEVLYSKFLKEAGGDLNDPVCSAIDQYVRSGCADIYDKDQCLESDTCIWTDENRCDVSDYALGRAALKRDDELVAEWEEVHTACKVFTDKETCEGGALSKMFVA